MVHLGRDSQRQIASRRLARNDTGARLVLAHMV